MYKIKAWFPNDRLNGAAFYIVLTRKWKETIAASDLNQEKIDNLIQNAGNNILKGHGQHTVESHVLQSSLRIKWGEWGGGRTHNCSGQRLWSGYRS